MKFIFILSLVFIAQSSIAGAGNCPWWGCRGEDNQWWSCSEGKNTYKIYWDYVKVVENDSAWVKVNGKKHDAKILTLSEENVDITFYDPTRKQNVVLLLDSTGPDFYELRTYKNNKAGKLLSNKVTCKDYTEL